MAKSKLLISRKKKTRAARKKEKLREPLPPRVLALLRESWLIVAGGLLIYFGLVLATYSALDPGWSHRTAGSTIHNAGGEAGAYLADLLFYLFGLSAFWFEIGLLVVFVWLFRHLRSGLGVDRRPNFLALVGFILLLVSSSSFECLRLYSVTFDLPEGPGGLVGKVISSAISANFGFTGSTLLLIILMAVGATLFFGLSWIELVEKIGFILEQTWKKIKVLRDIWLDRRAGEIATDARTERLDEVRERRVYTEAPRIEPGLSEIAKSERVEKEKQKPLFEELPDSELPPIHLLDEPEENLVVSSSETLEYTSRLIEKKLMDFGIEVRVVAAQPGPVITRYEIELAVGVKGSQVINLVKDLARALSVVSVRVVETIPGKTVMGLEIPNPKRQVVRLSEILSSRAYSDLSSPLTLALGKDIAGHPIVVDLARMPHLLVAGTTGSGKSVAINAMILSLLYKSTAKQVRLILIDPKMLELSVYEGIPQLLAPVVTDMKEAAHALNWCVSEMDRRYKLMSALGVRNLSGFNQKVREACKSGNPLKDPLSLNPEEPDTLEELPVIVVVIDELADLIMVVGKKIEELIARLAQKARAAGLHLVLATQRPSVDVITGLIKANIPTRVAFQVSSRVDSRTILDQMGAEQLLGQGDMLYLPPGTGFTQRVHGAFVADHEVHKVVENIKSRGEAQYLDEVLESDGGNVGSSSDFSNGSESDPLYDDAVQIVLKNRRASISLVQRHLRIGYNRAARLIEQMERAGMVSPMGKNGNREILVPNND